jgi:hypothetical protein
MTMQQFRTVRCDMWRKDDWFAELAPDAKLVWIYTFTNDSTSPAGIYRIALRTVANDTGIPLPRVLEIIAEFQQAGKLEYEDGVIWPVTMRKHQVGELNPKDNLVKRIANDLADLPDSDIVARYKAHYSQSEPPTNPLARGSESPSDTLPVNRRQETGYKRQDTGDKKQETGDGEGKRAAVATAPTFEAFQQARGGAVNPMDGEQLGELEALYGSDTTVQAIKWCNEHKDRSFLVIGYIAKTLAGWQRDGNVPMPKVNGNGKAPHETLTSWTSPNGRERIIGHADGREVRREPLEF